MTPLDKSIEHWERNFEAECLDDIKIGPDECALCDAFFYCNCDGCPVSVAGFSCCSGTPFDACDKLFAWMGDYDTFNKQKWQKVCRDEINFLKGLRS